jgi:hypothetical protein
MSRKLNAFIAVLVLTAGLAGAQESPSPALGFRREFARSSLSGKLQLLRDAAAANDASLAGLFGQALDFSLQNAELLRDDAEMVELSALAAEGLAAQGDVSSVSGLWRVFMAYRDARTRGAVLKALAVLGKDNGQIVENLNQYLGNQNNVYRTGMAPDMATLSACIATIGALGDSSSFPVLFQTMIAGYPDSVVREADAALRSIRGDDKKYLIDVVRRNPPAEKLAAFNAGQRNDAFNPAARGELAEAALEIALGLFPADPAEAAAVDNLRYAAVRVLTVQRWTRATTLAIKQFYRVQTDFGAGLVDKEIFLEAIRCLGAMASSEAAQALSLQLGLINSDMERTKAFDAEILGAVIIALGDIGDKVAFDYLLYIGYLPYPDAVKTAAREALNRLKW